MGLRFGTKPPRAVRHNCAFPCRERGDEDRVVERQFAERAIALVRAFGQSRFDIVGKEWNVAIA